MVRGANGVPFGVHRPRNNHKAHWPEAKFCAPENCRIAAAIANGHHKTHRVCPDDQISKMSVTGFRFDPNAVAPTIGNNFHPESKRRGNNRHTVCDWGHSRLPTVFWPLNTTTATPYAARSLWEWS